MARTHKIARPKLVASNNDVFAYMISSAKREVEGAFDDLAIDNSAAEFYAMSEIEAEVTEVEPTSELEEEMIEAAVEQLEGVSETVVELTDADLIGIESECGESEGGEDEKSTDDENEKSVGGEFGAPAPFASSDITGSQPSGLDDFSFTDEQLTTMAFAMGHEFKERIAFQQRKDPSNTKIVDNLKRYAVTLTSKIAARILLATNADPKDINRTLHDGSRYNVYAIDKLRRLVEVFNGDDFRGANAVNYACVKSLFQFEAAGIPFTFEWAKAAASNKIRVGDTPIAKHLTRHTVSTGVATTQASSTMQALMTLGIIARSSGRHPTYTILDTPQTRKLREIAQAA